MEDEKALIKAAQSGDSHAFEQLLEARYDTLYRFAYRWSGNATDAEDITQQACIKLAQGLKQFKFDAAFSTWLYRLVINCAKDWQRQQQRHINQRAGDDSDVANIPVPAPVEAPVYLRQVLSWVEGLGEGFKETLMLVFSEGMSHGEAAAVLDVKESTVSWRIHNVRKQLSLLDQENGGGQ